MLSVYAIRPEPMKKLTNLELGQLLEQVLLTFGEEILTYGPSPEEREEHLETLGRMLHKALLNGPK